ncbi:hypothetical protein Tco_1185410 [Tanacetum coccineum]
MEQMGFSPKGRNLIHGCLSSAYGSVFVNGSPTFNFDETTTLASTLNCEPSNRPFIYLGLPIGANMRKACHWKPIIDKFHNRLTSWKSKTLSYGGRLTLLKSVLGALGVYYFLLFKVSKSVITYLEKLRRNFFWGGTLDCNKLSWIVWNKVCSSSSVGGLGIGSLQAFNLALLLKWFWRFHIENDSLWKNIIISIHGMHRNFASHCIPLPSTSSIFISPWKSMAKLGNHLSCANIDICSLFVKKIGNGLSTKFWEDCWLGGCQTL